MAHAGKPYPVQQAWRLYSGNTQTTASLPPAVVLFRSSHWVCVFGVPPANIWIECIPAPWTAGEASITWRSALLTVGTHIVEIGVVGEIVANGSMRWRYAVWDGGVDQIPWGWHDTASHYIWAPGNAEIFGVLPVAGGTIYPVGVVEVKGQVWP